jgi:hypothetical protein
LPRLDSTGPLAVFFKYGNELSSSVSAEFPYGRVVAMFVDVNAQLHGFSEYTVILKKQKLCENM